LDSKDTMIMYVYIIMNMNMTMGGYIEPKPLIFKVRPVL
jgi:hypothetical protein